MESAETPCPDDDRGAPGRLPFLVISQILGGIGVASGVAVGGLLAEQISGSAAVAGLAQTASVLGGALLAVPMSRVAESRGRSPALSTGYAIAFVGAVGVIIAAVISSLPLLLVSMGMFGGGSAVGLQARYAAIDGVGQTHRARTLSIVVWATTVGAVLGPNLSALGGRLGQAIGIPRLAGPFVFSLAAFALAALVVLRLPHGRQPLAHPRNDDEPTGSVLSAIWRRPMALTGLVSMSAAHATMVAVMVMTPVHLGHDGAGLSLIGLVISLHIVGMYAFSPVMGSLTDRYGAQRTIMFGVFILFVSLLIATTARLHAHTQITVALFLLGLGWSACMVAGSALLSSGVPIEIRTRVQGTGDLILGLSAAAAGAVAGPILAATSYNTLALVTMLLLVPIMTLTTATRIRRPTTDG